VTKVVETDSGVMIVSMPDDLPKKQAFDSLTSQRMVKSEPDNLNDSISSIG
jgi:hypothetical protein